MWLLLFSAQTSALYRPSSAPHLRLRGGDGEETQQPGQETLAQALAMAQARVRMSLDPARYRSASQGPPGSFPLPEYGEIDRVIDRATQTDGWAPVIPQYNGTLRWARHQWKGTINEHLWRPAAVSMIVPFLFIGATRFVAPSARWFPSPDETHPIFATLLSISHGWGHLLGLTTFVVTFFVGHALSYWRNCYKIARQVQGRLNDLGMLAGAHAARGPDGTITPDAAALLERLARQARLAHLLFWSDVVYRRTDRKNMGASFRTLLSAKGLDVMHARGLIDAHEHATLRAAELPPARWYLMVIQWVMAGFSHGKRRGLLTGDGGFEAVVLGKVCELRGACMSLPDELAARIPLAYVHFTAFLVDALLFLSPLALLPRLGAFTIVLGPLIVLFYRGLLELSKSFLDPFGNRRVSTTDLSAEISIDTLIGESNAGSLVWPKGAQYMPFLAAHGPIGVAPEEAPPGV